MKKYFVMALFAILFAIFDVKSASSEEMMMWKECVSIAKENNPQLKSTGEKVRQAAKDIDIDLSQILPQVDSDLGGSRSESGGKKPADSYSYGMSGSQLLFRKFI